MQQQEYTKVCNWFIFLAVIEYTCLLAIYRCQENREAIEEAPGSWVWRKDQEEKVDVVAAYIDLIAGTAIAISFFIYLLS